MKLKVRHIPRPVEVIQKITSLIRSEDDITELISSFAQRCCSILQKASVIEEAEDQVQLGDIGEITFRYLQDQEKISFTIRLYEEVISYTSSVGIQNLANDKARAKEIVRRVVEKYQDIVSRYEAYRSIVEDPTITVINPIEETKEEEKKEVV